MKRNFDVLSVLTYAAVAVALILMVVLKCSCGYSSQLKAKKVIEEQHKIMIVLDSISTNRIK